LSSGKKINELRTDNGREYLSNEFQNFLKDAGIKHNTSVDYFPQMNGKAERLNRTLIEKARCMIAASNLDLNLWTAAVDTANYLRNRSPSTVLHGKSPYEVFFQKLPKINHLRVFGCEAYPLNINKSGEKFEPVAKKDCIMIGYGDSEGIYWIYDKKGRKVFRSRDIKFNENSLFYQNDQNTTELIIPNVQAKIPKIKNDESIKHDDKNEDDDKRNEENVSDDKSENGKTESNPDDEADNSDELQEVNDEQLPRRSSRVSKPPNRYKPGETMTQDKAYLNLLDTNEIYDEPTSFEEALKSKFKENWKAAIKSELDSLEENETWTISELPKNKKAIKTKWIFKIKRNSIDKPERFKARLVAKGYDQELGIDYHETFAPVVKAQSLRLLLAIAINERYKIHHVDISTDKQQI
jgi:hypothetical protein